MIMIIIKNCGQSTNRKSSLSLASKSATASFRFHLNTVHCNALCTALQCSALHCSSKKCIAMHLTIAIAQCTIVLQSNSINIVHCNAVHINTALQLKEVHCNAQCTIVIAHCTIVLQSSSINIVHCFVIQILSLHCILYQVWMVKCVH